MIFNTTRAFASKLDQKDELSKYREYFYYPKNEKGEELIYFCGNSLGLQPKKVPDYIKKELDLWSTQGVRGQDSRWITFHEKLAKPSANLIGANEKEVVVMNALTVNIHLLLISFYQPKGKRIKIIMEKDAFPSDQYAIKSQVKYHGYNPEDTIIELVPRKNEKVLRNEDILKTIDKYGDETALIYLGGVNYYTGQSFDLESISQAGKSKGSIVGFNLAHSVGNISMKLHEWGIDFSAWCTYKYLCAGPGSPSGVYIHERHHNWSGPRLTGWWGHNKNSRFDMPSVFDPICTSEGWQISNAPVLGMAPLFASLEIFDKVGINDIASKGKKLSNYMEYLLVELVSEVTIITPKKRGCQLSITVSGGKKIFEYLQDQGVVCDWRNPDVIRLAPHPLFNTFIEIFEFVNILRKAIDQ